MRLAPDAYAAQPPLEPAAGAVLDPVAIEVTRAMVVMSAAATWTFYAGHTDSAYAQVQGRRDIYLPTGAINGLVDRYVLLRLGPATFIRLRKVAMRASICAGDTVTFEGRIERVTPEPHGRVTRGRVEVVELALAVTNADGHVCVTATVVAELPLDRG